MITPRSQFLWQMSRMLYLFIYSALSQLPLPCFDADSSEPLLAKQCISCASLPSKQHSGLASPCPWVRTQTKPNQESQTKITLFFIFLLFCSGRQEKNWPGLQNLNLRTLLISNWLPFPTPLCPAETSQHCRASARSSTFPKPTQGAAVWKEWLPAKGESE